jgi:hypothetical protein
MRTKEEIQQDYAQLLKEINAVIDTMGDTGAPHLALYAVLDARPDLNKRHEKLIKEAKHYENLHKM